MEKCGLLPIWPLLLVANCVLYAQKLQMHRIEDFLTNSIERVDILERKLQTKLLTMENREKLERELEDVKRALTSNRQRLLHLRSQNSRSFMVTAALFFALFLFYGLYTFIKNLGQV